MRITHLILALCVVLSGCAANVVTDYDAAASFDQYQSWAFSGDQQESGFLSLDSARVEAALVRELNAKNLVRRDADEADLLVSYQLVQEDRLETYGFSYGVGFGHRNFGWGLATAPQVREVTEGKLVVRLADRNTQQVVWQAISKRYLNENQSPETRSELIDESVTDMFALYPPAL
ncbi:DUF4136 domain-containing protein [Marinobacter zhejiangensis]|uniref:DUF4136 domain-containing protein n=1 Tax=Marinobacter zhejiangensis TaxID=488535 RepID=A0A1I4QCT2_9GAMM|nr:DUF4136 domain-containing protein [Marinobacter zhejiangensis]SFM37859.1 protein of unknown function [Marinobacter zhejiangensis]